MGLFNNIFGTSVTSQTTRTSTPRHKSSLSGPGKEASLNKGDILKGEVTDLRSNEVTLRLNDGRTLHAKLATAAELAIGQETEFLVQDSDESLIVLKLLSDSDSSFTESAIDKALESSGIPKSQQAVSIVRALLIAGLPANKDMLRKMMQYSAANRDVELSTLTTLLKSEIPVTRTNASQLQAYRNFEHRLLSQASTLTSSIGSALRFGEASPEFAVSLLASFFPEEAPTLPVTTASSDSFIYKPDTDRQADSLETEIISRAASDAEPTANAFPAQTNPSEVSTASAVFQKDSGMPLTSLLAEPQNKAINLLLEELSAGFPEEPAFSALQSMPERTAQQLFSALASFGGKNPSALASLLKKEPVLTELLDKTLLSGFVLQPEDLEKEDAVKTFYEELNRTLAKMTELCKESPSSPALKTATDTAGKMQDNLSFMNSLNQLFPYIQLPLKMTEQLTHGELYVYTKKKDLSAQNKEVSILLHLDMDSLGPTDIHVSLLRQAVNAQFYLPDEESASAVSGQLSELTTALSQKGFLLTAGVSVRTKEAERITDLLTGGENVPMKRFRFDIRA